MSGKIARGNVNIKAKVNIEESALPPSPPSTALLAWARSVLGASGGELAPVAGDASQRRYYRLALGAASYIVVEAPPATEKNARFLAVRETLERGGIRVPRLFAADLERGFLLLGDLGDRLLLRELDGTSADSCYRQAWAVLLRLVELRPDDRDWPGYDAALLGEELRRFPVWFSAELMGRPLNDQERQWWDELCAELVESALEQPVVLVHRDFHSRNLMPQPDGSLGVIDFQDAVIGPVTYDLVSLLRDCYIRWPASRVEAWALEYLGQLRLLPGMGDLDEARFLRWFDLMGLQRHLKVLGTFARLYLRDGKPAYLGDLPRVVAYVEEILEKYRADWPAAEWFASWFSKELRPRFDRQPWRETH